MKSNNVARIVLITFAIMAAVSAAMALLAGCGSGGHSALPGRHATGSAVFTVKWPTRSRLIPVASNALTITITQGSAQVATATISRPNTSAIFSALPVGTLTATITAYPNANGTGVAQATASAPLAIQAGQQTVLPLTLASTIAQLKVTPASPLNVVRGHTLNVIATALDANNNVVVVQSNNVLWSVKDPTVAAVTSSGTSVTLTGVASGATSLTVTEVESGKSTGANIIVSPAIFVTDTANDRVVSLDALGNSNFAAFGTQGGGSGNFSLPDGVATDALNRIYIADSQNNRIVRINDISGAGFVAYGGPSAAPLSNPNGVALDSNGNIYVADTGNNRIVEFADMQGTNFQAYGGGATGIFAGPMGIALDGQNHIYVADTGNLRIDFMNDITGAGFTFFGGSASELFGNPVAVAVDSQNRIYVADSGFNQVDMFNDITGTGFRTYRGPSSSGLYLPGGIAVDGQFHIYITDTGNNRLVRVDDITGTNFTSYGSAGSGVGQFNTPTGIIVR